MELSELRIVGRGFGWLAVCVSPEEESDGTVLFETMLPDRSIRYEDPSFFFKLYIDPSEDQYSTDIYEVASMVLDFADIAQTTLNSVHELTSDTAPRAVVFSDDPRQKRSDELQDLLRGLGPMDHRILAVELTMRDNPQLKL